jgi:hypothetical protein
MDNPISFKALSGLWVRSAESLMWGIRLTQATPTDCGLACAEVGWTIWS